MNRSDPGVAEAWATLQFLGRDGCMPVAAALMDFVDACQAGIRVTQGLKILGEPDLSPSHSAPTSSTSFAWPS